MNEETFEQLWERATLKAYNSNRPVMDCLNELKLQSEIDRLKAKIEELEAFKEETLTAIERSYINNCTIMCRDHVGGTVGDRFLISGSHPLEIHLDHYHIIPSENYKELEAKLKLAVEGLEKLSLWSNGHLGWNGVPYEEVAKVGRIAAETLKKPEGGDA